MNLISGSAAEFLGAPSQKLILILKTKTGMPFLDVHVWPNHSFTAYSNWAELAKIATVNFEDVVSWNQQMGCSKRMSKRKSNTMYEFLYKSIKL